MEQHRQKSAAERQPSPLQATCSLTPELRVEGMVDGLARLDVLYALTGKHSNAERGLKEGLTAQLLSHIPEVFGALLAQRAQSAATKIIRSLIVEAQDNPLLTAEDLNQLKRGHAPVGLKCLHALSKIFTLALEADATLTSRFPHRFLPRRLTALEGVTSDQSKLQAAAVVVKAFRQSASADLPHPDVVDAFASLYTLKNSIVQRALVDTESARAGTKRVESTLGFPIVPSVPGLWAGSPDMKSVLERTARQWRALAGSFIRATEVALKHDDIDGVSQLWRDFPGFRILALEELRCRSRRESLSRAEVRAVESVMIEPLTETERLTRSALIEGGWLDTVLDEPRYRIRSCLAGLVSLSPEEQHQLEAARLFLTPDQFIMLHNTGDIVAHPNCFSYATIQQTHSTDRSTRFPIGDLARAHDEHRAALTDFLDRKRNPERLGALLKPGAHHHFGQSFDVIYYRNPRDIAADSKLPGRHFPTGRFTLSVADSSGGLSVTADSPEALLKAMSPYI